MKSLTRIRLINWHRFENETIAFGGSVLLSGENGAGKSTILDAIQFVMTCTTAYFNKAAHEKGDRSLGSYVRCKTGKEDRPYNRSGSISAHIALEFYDDEKGQYFIAGAVMDSASEETEPAVRWYILENRELDDALFFTGNRVKSISQFLSTNKGVRYERTKTAASKMMADRFGRLERKKFTSLIPKALAFRPIHNIKEFVYTYVLDEKKLNIDALRENVRSFQELEKVLQDVRSRIEELEIVRARKAEVDNYIRIDSRHEYYLARVEKDLVEEAIHDAKDTRRQATGSIRHLKSEETKLDKLLAGKEESIIQLRMELESDEKYKAGQELENRKRNLEETLKADQLRVRDLYLAADDAAENAAALVAELKAGSETADDGQIIQMFTDYVKALKGLRSLADLTIVHIGLQAVQEYKREHYDAYNRRLAECSLNVRALENDLRELNGRIRMLEDKKLVYRPEVEMLQSAVREQLRSLGRPGEVRILCELLEITKPAWRNAVEGYLNTQRFYLITEPEDFDLALSVYERLRSQRKLYGVGLVNTAKLEGYEEAPEGSLAECVTSSSVWARRYVNMVLGKVHCADSYQELKQYPVAITRQCMRYQNHVASAISPRIYEKPYIGAGAYAVQLKQAMEDRQELERRLADRRNEREHLDRIARYLSADADRDVRYNLGSLETMRAHETELENCSRELAEIKASRTMIQKQNRLETLETEKRDLNMRLKEVSRGIGNHENAVRNAEAQLERLAVQQKNQEEAVADLYKGLGDDAADCEKEYLKQTAEREFERYRQNYEAARKGNRTRREKAENQMAEAMRKYKSAHDFGAADSMEGFPEFNAEYYKLKDSKLLEYEEKVRNAREKAEQEFREQFLARLQENIKQAQTEFRSLNRALADIHFSNERYEFRHEPRKHLKKFYDMIMDDFNVLGGESLFSSSFNDAHREAIDELFEKLTLDDENSAKTLEEYTDYRTYMDYDIRITFDDGSYMLYSKVSREKSGGETQTPFYITIAASFMQLYRSSIGGDAIGLIMMDEAFNNMDDSRMEGVLSFMTGSNLQTIIAAPPEKIQYIAPSVDSVLLVLTDGEMSYVEEFDKPKA